MRCSSRSFHDCSALSSAFSTALRMAESPPAIIPITLSVRHAIGWGNFRSIDNAQAPAGTGPDIKKPAATLHLLHNSRHQSLDSRNNPGYSLGHGSIFLVYINQQITHTHLLQILIMRSRLRRAHGKLLKMELGLLKTRASNEPARDTDD